MVTPKERVYKAIAHEETDIVPYNVSVHPRAHEKLVKVYGEHYDEDVINHFASVWPLMRLFPRMGEDFPYSDPKELKRVRRNLTIAGFPPEYARAYHAVPEKLWMDDFGCMWLQSPEGAPYVFKHALSEPSLESYEFPDFSDPRLYKHIPTEIENNKDKFFVGGAGLLFFERAWALRGLDKLLIDFYRHPDFAEDLLENLTEISVQVVEGIVQYDVDAVLFSDDFGMQKGLIMGPRIWREFLKPRLRQIYGTVKEAGKLVMIHSCGDNSEIMGDLIEIGVDIFDPTQPEAMDIFELKRKWGTQITFEGGLPSQKLPFYTPEQIRNEVVRVRSFMSEGGGFVLAPTKEIRWDTPPDTAMALIDEIAKPSDT